MKYICFITVRSLSTRLKNKCFLDFGGVKVLEHIILRCIYGGLIPIVCTSENKADKKIIKLSKLMNIQYFIGPEKNKILRWYLCCKKYNINFFHTLDADDLFFDWDSIKTSLKTLKEKKYDAVFPSKISRKGGASEGYSFSRDGIKKMINNFEVLKSKNNDIEMIDPYLKNLDKKILKGSSYQLKETRLTLDYNEDYLLFQKIREKLGNLSHRKKINSFLKKNSKILKINFFRNKDWNKRQKLIIANNMR